MLPLSAVLLVDDDPTTNFLNRRLLRCLAVQPEVLVASNGLAALKLLQDRCHQATDCTCPTLVLLDMNMPVMSGMEFLETFVKVQLPVAQRQGIVIVLLTTTLLERDLARLRQLPVVEVLHKPLTEQAITNIIASYFGESHLKSYAGGESVQ
ncbi:MAG: response regulator [Hymenobacter sp.]|nr:MAG: response regulator [Hymenobacter sp.]